MNPKQVFKNRTARLAKEAQTPVYTSEAKDAK
jgi:hypothetical protein